MRTALNSSVVWELTTEGEGPFNCGIVRGKWVLQGITVCLVSKILGTVWCPGRIQTVSRGICPFSIDTAQEWILWKRSREDRSLRASRDGHSSSSSISLTLLVFRHLLQVQRAAVLWTFSTWLIWSFELGLQMGAAYSSLVRTKVTSCFVYKVIRDLESIFHTSELSIRISSSGV